MKWKIIPIIFAAGNGTRLKEISQGIPKPLVKLYGGDSFIEYQIRFFKLLGLNDIYIFYSSHYEEFATLSLKYSHIDVKLHLLQTESLGHAYPLLQYKELFIKSPNNIIFGLNGDIIFEAKNRNVWDKLIDNFKGGFAGMYSNRLPTLKRNLIVDLENSLIGIKINGGKHNYYYVDSNNVTEKYVNYLGMFLLEAKLLNKIDFKKSEFVGLFGQKDLIETIYHYQQNKRNIDIIMKNLNTSEYFNYYYTVNTPREYHKVNQYITMHRHV